MRKLLANLAAKIRARPRTALASTAGPAAVLLGAWLLWRVPGHNAPLPPGPLLPVREPHAPRPTEIVTFEQGCVTSACHGRMDEPEMVHMPAGERECSACHAPDAGGHTFPLRRPRPDLCTTCHETGLHRAVQHRAMTEDGCLGCHRAHGGTRWMLLASPAAAACASCHPPVDGPVKHPPYAERRCEVCHDSHGSDSRGLLRTASAETTCGTCHPGPGMLMASSRHTHRSVKGSCSACHAPHAGQTKGLLSAPTRELCTSCHTDVGREVSGARVGHDAVLKGEQCIRCHDPHASDRPGMLRDAQEAVCLSCHDKPATAADGRRVAAMPASHGDAAVPGHRECSGCHSIHGGTHERLLQASAVRLPEGPYDRRSFALCYSCHDAMLAEDPTATLFRDGDVNLHRAHLTGEKARGCSACHSVHALGEPRLIAKTVNFEGSGWNMPMNFTMTAEGGRCGSGCHEALDYSRRPGGAKAQRAGPGGQGGAP